MPPGAAAGFQQFFGLVELGGGHAVALVRHQLGRHQAGAELPGTRRVLQAFHRTQEHLGPHRAAGVVAEQGLQFGRGVEQAGEHPRGRIAHPGDHHVQRQRQAVGVIHAAGLS
jgi:hypothetical protein